MSYLGEEKTNGWEKILAQAIKSPTQLLEKLSIDVDESIISKRSQKRFPLLVPHPFFEKMEKGNINDPLLRQVFPRQDEDLISEGFMCDPLGEHDNKVRGLLHKYPNRILLILKTGCAINCRYCFRQYYPYKENSINKKQLQEISAYIKNHPKINEVILSGGDPLMSKEPFLANVIKELESIEQLTRLRFHTRLPVVIPERITPSLCTLFEETRFKIIVVLHINHGNEIDKKFKLAMNKLTTAGVILLNQSVLLRGVNDKKEVLVNLSNRLFDAGILPYYLFLLDKVQGSAHFNVDENQAKVLLNEISEELPGYLIPKLSKEVAGQKSKTVIGYDR